MTTTAQNRHTRRLRRGPIVALLLLMAGLGLAATTAVAPAAFSHANRSGEGFGWPVKPFDRPHPVRGTFGDPRTVFSGPPTMRGLMSGAGRFSFHQGVDISAPDGTAVYPVTSGVVSQIDNERGVVYVTCDDGIAFEYWHIVPQVAAGQQVDAYRTVLGRIMRPSMHVHVTVIENGVVVNPLVRGRLTPYADHTQPSVDSVSFLGRGGQVLPNFVRGRVQLVAEATDTPTLRVPGIWRDLPVTPALVQWRIQRWPGKPLRRGVAYDVRNRIPDNSGFWSTYARGTFQNMAVFGKHYSYLQRGTYLFKLTPEPLDTRRLRDGVYDLVVTAEDIRGNRDTLSRRFTIHNAKGWR